MPREARAAGLARLASLERLLLSLVRAEDGEALIARARRDGFAEHGLDPRDADALAAADVRRLLVYRKLVRGNLLDAVALQIPLTAARLGDRYRDEVLAFCARELPRSPILRDAAFEFVRWATPRWKTDERLAPYLADLARYELLEFDVRAAERLRPAMPDPEELPPDRPLRFDGSCRLGRFDHAVHGLPDDPADRTTPAREPTCVLAYRDAHNDFRQLTLTPLAADILELLLLERAPLAHAVRTACERTGHPIDSGVIDGTATLLADLADRGALVGPEPAADAPPPHPPWRVWLCRADQ